MTQQVSYDLRELAIALIKDKQIHEGKWTVGFEFTLGAAILGPTPEEVLPSAVAQIVKALLTPASPSLPVHLVVDAAEVNPAPRSRKRQRASK